MKRCIALMIVVVLAAVFVSVGGCGSACHEASRPRVDGRHGKRDRRRVAESAMHDRCLLLDHRLSGRWAGREAGDEDHLDVEGRLQYEARDVAGQDRLRQVGQGSDERHRSPLTEV